MRSYPLLLGSIASEAWAIEPGYAAHALAALEARIGNGAPWPHESRDVLIADGNARFYAAGMPMELSGSEGGPARLGNTAVMQLVGILMPRISPLSAMSGGGGTSLVSFAQHMSAAAADPSVASILCIVDSPGGTVTSTRDAYQAVAEAAKMKEVVFVCAGTCASAALWISSAASTLILTPGSQAGSIGAVAMHDDVSKMMSKVGVTSTVYASSKHKADFSPHAPLSADAAANMREMVDRAHMQFVADVAKGRGVTPSVVERTYGQGKMLDAASAKAVGMVDAIEPLARVMTRMAKAKVGTTLSQPRVRAEAMATEERAGMEFRKRRHMARQRMLEVHR